MRRILLVTLTLLALCVSSASAAQPNVLIILADDLGYSDLGCYGGEIATPNLDTLAKNGLRFTQFYNTTRCWPSRAALLTGYYAQAVRRDSMRGVPGAGGQGVRPKWARLLPEFLKSAGYHNYHSGKWHVDGTPLVGGFEKTFTVNMNTYFEARSKNKDDKSNYATVAIADHAVECLKHHAANHADKPFFSYVAFTSPHFPLHALPEDIAKYKEKYLVGWEKIQQARYAQQKKVGITTAELAKMEVDLGPPYHFPEALKKLGAGEVNRPLPWAKLTDEQKKFQAAKMAVHAAMVDRMDQEIGRILAQLKAMKVYDDTLILFASDNGASAEIMVRGGGHDTNADPGSGATYLCLGPGWASAANTPFRRHKTWVHEGGISTPLVVHWPKGIKARGELRHTPAHLIDVVPTVFDVAKAEKPAKFDGIDLPAAPGKSLLPAFAKDVTVERDYLWWLHEESKALRVGNWKAVSAKDAAWELYDLKTDRSEQHDLAAKMPDKVKELSATWQKHADAFAKLATQEPAKQQEKKKSKDEPKGGKAKKGPTAGAAVGENKATPIERVRALPGFKVELLYSVPGNEQGSWVNLCEDDKGRLYVSDQYGGLYRFTPPAPGQVLDKNKIEKVDVKIRAVNGMVFAFGALYVGVNDYEGKISHGLYRITDTDKDDRLDKVELLRAFDGKGDHGVHAVVPTPDGKALYLICGNGTKPTKRAADSPAPANYGEDHLLPRMPDGRGFMRDVMAPGGIVYRVTPDGKEFSAYAAGFRNIFDAAVNREGELFTFDADMEYDFNTPWYRPTRICHVVSGAEYGWRNGAGKRPEWYPDNLPPVINIGPGSPTGVTFGYGAKFPAKYQNALYALDWSWGKLYAVHLEPNGASYTATKEEFLSGMPLPLTDAIISQKDGAMYFAIGGRRVQSGLYRVSYTGSEKTDAAQVKSVVTDKAKLRHQLEAFHGVKDAKAVKTAWEHLGDSDRFIRWAARTAIEHQPTAEWADKALNESNAAKQVEALMALARCTGVCPQHRAEKSTIDTTMRDKLLAALLKLDLAKLPHETRLTALRTLQIVLNRFGMPDGVRVKQLIAQLDPLFPAKTPEENWLLCETLVFLQSPTVAAKGMAMIASAPTQEEQMEYARSLRMLKVGWTERTRIAQLEWFLKAANYKGGASFDKFMEFIRHDSLATFSDAEKKRHAALIDKKPERLSVIENVGAMFAGRTPKKWTLDELSKAAETGLKERDFENGRKIFAAAACFTCHRFDNQGGMTGPDLTAAGRRYSPRDLLDQIINPSKEINEQFVPTEVVMTDGERHSGIVVNLNGDRIVLNTDLTNPNQRKNIDRKEVKSMGPSKVSPMPEMLLGMLTRDEILDMLAYIISGGDRKNAMFK